MNVSFKGEFTCMDLVSGLRINTFDKITDATNSICNSITLYNQYSDTHILISDNDSYVRDIAVDTMQCVAEYGFDYPVNYAVTNPTDTNAICIVGDAADCSIIDARTKQTTHKLVGHTDHIYDHTTQYKTAQTIDLFGEISGVSITPDNNSIFIAVTDRIYGCLLEYTRNSIQLMDLYDTRTL
jgi:hypothetical protein